MSAHPAKGTGTTMDSTSLAGDAVTLAPLLPKMGVASADGCNLNWRAMLFFGASAKGLRYLPTLQGMKSISHDQIRLKQEKTKELTTHLSIVMRQMCLGGEPLDLCSASLERDRFEPASCSWAEGLAPLRSWGTTAEPPASAGTSGGAVEPPTPVGS